MISTSIDNRSCDLALAYREHGEQAAIEAQRRNADVITSFAIVVLIGGEEIELVTQCNVQGRANWRELLGIKLHEFNPRLGAVPVEDIDLVWGMAWLEANGSIRRAGPNLAFVKRAIRNIQEYAFDQSGLRLTVENSDAHDGPFAFFGTTTEGDKDVEVYEDLDVRAFERSGVMEIYGFEPETSDPWGMAWQPISVPATTRAAPNPEPEIHGVIVVAGNNPQYAFQAFNDLAVCN